YMSQKIHDHQQNHQSWKEEGSPPYRIEPFKSISSAFVVAAPGTLKSVSFHGDGDLAVEERPFRAPLELHLDAHLGEHKKGLQPRLDVYEEGFQPRRTAASPGGAVQLSPALQRWGARKTGASPGGTTAAAAAA